MTLLSALGIYVDTWITARITFIEGFLSSEERRPTTKVDHYGSIQKDG